jgi:hypothetical protein
VSAPPSNDDLVRATEEANRQARVDQIALNEKKRRPLYRDVEELINPGFISHRIQLGNSSIILRSPSPGDMYLLRWRVPSNATDRVWKEWVTATCIWMIDGYSFLEDTHSVIRIQNTLRWLPERALNVLWSVVHGLMNRVSAAVGRAEAFCYERHSRALWRFCGRQSPAGEEFTGVPGTTRLGMNIIQQIWVGYNLAEDDRLNDVRRWHEAKLVASAHAPKGIKKLNQSDEMREKREDRRRNRILDEMYFEAEGWKDKHSELVFQPYTADELVEQMRRWRDGEKDLHDIVVDAYRERISEGIRKADEERERRRVEREAMEANAEEHLGALGVVGYTVDQVKNMVGKSFRKGGTVVYDRPRRDQFDKYVQDSGDIGFMTDAGVAVPQPMDQSVTLNDKVASRAGVQFGSDDSFIPPNLRDRFRDDVEQAQRHGGPPIPPGREDGD